MLTATTLSPVIRTQQLLLSSFVASTAQYHDELGLGGSWHHRLPLGHILLMSCISFGETVCGVGTSFSALTTVVVLFVALRYPSILMLP